jgi:hypothetical protein
VLLICGLAWSSGLIHVQAAVDHLDESKLYALLFIVLAVAQVGWGIALYRSSRPGLLMAGVIVSLGVLGVWILSRTSGLPIGPAPGSPEEVGVLDALASADEIALVCLAALQLRSPGIDRLGRGSGSLLRAGVVCLIFASSLVLAGGIHAH